MMKWRPKGGIRKKIVAAHLNSRRDVKMVLSLNKIKTAISEGLLKRNVNKKITKNIRKCDPLPPDALVHDFFCLTSNLYK